MYITIGEREFCFYKMELEMIETNIQNIFAKFDKKTIQDLIQHKRYESLKSVVEKHYKHLLNLPVGKGLLHLKNEGDTFYKEFLNKYGDRNFSQFIVKGNDALLNRKGIYTIDVDDELVFAGICSSSFKLRFNQHIGNLSPKSCYKDGTATHCHINAQITEKIHRSKINFKICPMKETDDVRQVKNAIIKRFEPIWNLRASNDEFLSYS